MSSAVDASSASPANAPPALTTTPPHPPTSDQGQQQQQHSHHHHQHHHSTSTTTSLPSPITPAKTNQDLAALLTQAYGENDTLRKELVQMKRRADKAERLAQSLTAVAESGGGQNGNGNAATTNGTNNGGGQQPLSESTVRLIRDLEDRLAHAEIAREESEAKRRMVLEHWAQVDGYLGTLEYKAAEARTNFGRILRENAFGPPGTQYMPPPPTASSSKHSRNSSRSHMVAFPQPSSPVTSRRQRTPSMDSAYPPSKRSRGEDYPPTPRFAYSESAIHGPPPQGHTIRVIQPSEKYPHPQGRHARAGSHSSASSMDVDEMLLRTTVDERGAPNGTAPGTAPTPLQAQGSTVVTSSHRTRSARAQPQRAAVEDQQQQQGQGQQVFSRGVTQPGGAYPANQSDPREFGGRKRDPLQGTAPLQHFNTHVFAPPVTGAPIKKSKYSSANLASQGSLDPQSQSTPQAVFPASNAAGQRICRQCGQVGRYKDGKCVEKWGPGPMGPGTVCDRCRKKMKRVERRGTLEAQQQQAQQAALAQAQLQANMTAQPQAQAVVHVSQVQQRQPHPNAAAGLTRTDTIPTNLSTSSRTERDRPPKESHLRTQPATAPASNGKPSSPSKPSAIAPPLHHSPEADRTEMTDSDADADAEAEAEAEILGAASIASGGSGTSTRAPVSTSKTSAPTKGEATTSAAMDVDEMEDGEGDAEADAEVDPETDLLEAVHAAERNSSAGSNA